MDNSELPHQETLVRLYALRAMLDHGADLAADHLPYWDGSGPCDDCEDAEATKCYGRLQLCRKCAVARLKVAESILTSK